MPNAQPPLPPAAVQALRQARPDLPNLLTSMVPNTGRTPLTAAGALFIFEQMLYMFQTQQGFNDVVTIDVEKTDDGLTVRVAPK